jgi:hypothetical protein
VADEGVHSSYAVAAQGVLRAPADVQREVRDVLVLRDPLVGDEPVRTEHCVRRHHGRQGTGDRRLARVGVGFERPVVGAIGSREELLFPSPRAPWRRCRRTAPASIGSPPPAQWRRVNRRVALVPDPLPRPLSALTLVGFVGFDDDSKAIVTLPCNSADDRHVPDAVTRDTQELRPAAACCAPARQ